LKRAISIFENITEVDDNPEWRKNIMYDGSILMQELVNRFKAALDKKAEEKLKSRNAAHSTSEEVKQRKVFHKKEIVRKY
jgi:hypothetical protein